MINERREILFLYDVSWANPNGDPLDENKPRIDEETLINYVTDVRLKRTIRDYLHDFKNQEIFLREERVKDDEGKKKKNLKTKEELYKEYDNSLQKVLERCIDIRLFGITLALKKAKKGESENEEEAQFSITGPVQFKYGHSLHKVKLEFVKGTTVLPSKEKREQGTFTEKYVLPYSLIAFYGVVNENAAKSQNIPLTDKDLDLMIEGIWEGTKNLLSTSKIGQMPRFLLEVTYKEKNYYIGELDKKIKLITEKLDEEVRDISEVSIDATDLVEELLENLDKILSIKYKIDERTKILYRNEILNFKEIFKGTNIEEIHF